MVSELVPRLKNNICGSRVDVNRKVSITESADIACLVRYFKFFNLLKCARAHSHMGLFHDVLSEHQTFVFITLSHSVTE